MDTKQCEVCGKAFERPRGLAHAQWASRKLCSKKCSGVLASTRKKAQPVKRCEFCGVDYTKGTHEGWDKWNTRKSCGSSACRSKRQDKGGDLPLVKTCDWCEMPMVRRAGEANQQWAKRKTCCKECAVLSTARTRTIYGFAPKTCTVCGKKFMANTNETGVSFNKRQTCGKICGASLIAKARVNWFDVHGRVNELRDLICVVCGAQFSVDRVGKARRFKAKKTCSKECLAKLMAEIRFIPMDEKVCVRCGKTFGRNAKDNQRSWARRRFCSQICWASQKEVRKYKLEPKACKICGVFFERRANESVDNFNSRQTCGRQCGYRLGAAKQLGHPRKGDKAPGRLYGKYPVEFFKVRWIILKRDGYRCRLCGDPSFKKRGLHVHHINYAKSDIREINLLSLCATCHIKTNFNRDHWQRFFEAMMLEDELAATG